MSGCAGYGGGGQAPGNSLWIEGEANAVTWGEAGQRPSMPHSHAACPTRPGGCRPLSWAMDRALPLPVSIHFPMAEGQVPYPPQNPPSASAGPGHNSRGSTPAGAEVSTQARALGSVASPVVLWLLTAPPGIKPAMHMLSSRSYTGLGESEPRHSWEGVRLAHANPSHTVPEPGGTPSSAGWDPKSNK